MIFDKQLYSLHRDKAARNINEANFLLEYGSEDLIDRILLINKAPKEILDIGSRNGILTKKLALLYQTNNITAIESSKKMLELFKDHSNVKKIWGDDEALIPFSEGGFDLVTSLLNMHWLNQPINFLNRVYSLLSIEGIFIGNLYGGNSLSILRNKCINLEEKLKLAHQPRISPMMRLEDLVKLFQHSSFGTVIADIYNLKINYSNIYSLIQDLRFTGETEKFYEFSPRMTKELALEIINSKDSIVENIDIISFLAVKNYNSLNLL